MAMSQDETFGPVAGIRRFGDEEEGIRIANDTPYGLAAYFYSRDIGRVWRVGEGLDYGIVGVNTGFVSTEVAPFGGMKESGIGREGSKYGIEDWLEIKYLAMGGIDAMRLADRVVIVTGGAQGIGRAIAQRLHEEGATIVVADLQGHEAAAEELGGLGRARRRLAARPTPQAMAAAALERYGRIDALVNNAGIYSSLVPKPFEQIDVDEWRKVYDVNVLGMFLARARSCPRCARPATGASSTSPRARPTRACRSCCTTSRARAR